MRLHTETVAKQWTREAYLVLLLLLGRLLPCLGSKLVSVDRTHGQHAVKIQKMGHTYLLDSLGEAGLFVIFFFGVSMTI